MRRVIVHGKKFERGPIKCSKCECEFVYSDEDIHQEKISYFDEETGWEKYDAMVIHCPECNHQIELKEYKI